MQRMLISEKLQRYYCEKTDLVYPKVALEWVNKTGWESEIYAFKLTFGPKNERDSKLCILRLLIGANFDAAEREYGMLSLLHKSGYPVPEPNYLGSPNDGFERPFIIMQCIKGGTLSDQNPRGLTLDYKSLQKFIALFRRLHVLNWQIYMPDQDSLSPPNDPLFYYNLKLASYSHLLKENGIKVFDPVMIWLRDRSDGAACQQGSLVHMDFHPDNILVDEGGDLYVIDWSAAEISDYRFDLAWTLILATEYQGLDAREVLLTEYERQMGQKVQSLEIFEVVSILRRIGSIMLSLSTGAESLGMRSDTESVMLQQKGPLLRLYDRLINLTGLNLPEIEKWLKGFSLEL